MPRLRSLAAAALAAAACAPALLGMDTITLKDGAPQEGIFQSFQDDRVRFRTADGRELAELRARVTALTLDPPARVLVRIRGRKQAEDLTLTGYDKGRFTFERDGKPYAVATLQVSAIEVSEFNREKKVLAQPNAPAPPDAGAEPAEDVEQRVQPGKVTILHFHVAAPETAPSVRQENYVASLPDRHKGRVAVERIDIPAWTAPVARRYAIQSSPQFWFYNRAGKQVARLVERFTEQDIDDALRKTMR